jgi:hypothetical protein
MTVIRRPLTADGAVVDVVVGWGAAQAHKLLSTGQPIPSPLQASALIDTGAEMTCIDSSLARQLSFPLGGFLPANVPAHGGLTFGVICPASLIVVHPSGKAKKNFARHNIAVMELQLAALQYQVLLGRDVLKRCRFLYDGIQQIFGLKY